MVQFHDRIGKNTRQVSDAHLRLWRDFRVGWSKKNAEEANGYNNNNEVRWAERIEVLKLRD